MGSGADYHYRSESDYLRMIETARDMRRNDVIFKPAINKYRSNIIQNGFTLDPQTGDEKLDADLKARWIDWSTDARQCDMMGEMAFVDMEEKTLESCAVDGDIFALPLIDGSLQMLESERCRTPKNVRKSRDGNIVHGIKMDHLRRRLQYWFTKDEIDPSKSISKIGDMDRVDAFAAPNPNAPNWDREGQRGQRQVLHIIDPERFTQTRGVTIFAPTFDTASGIEDINFSTIIRHQIASIFAVIREREVQFDARGDGGQMGAQSTEAQGDGSKRLIEEVAPGMEIKSLPGEKVKLDAPRVPAPEFFEHVKFLLQLFGNHLSLPLVMLLMDASETNFSGWRGAIQQAHMEFRRVQQWMARRFHRPVYMWKVRQWALEDTHFRTAAERLDIAIFRHNWQAPRWTSIQPLVDATAHDMRLRTQQTSPRRGAAELGLDHRVVIDETIADNRLTLMGAIDAAEDIRQQTGVEVDYHELLYVPAPGQFSLSMSLPLEQDREDKKS